MNGANGQKKELSQMEINQILLNLLNYSSSNLEQAVWLPNTHGEKNVKTVL